MFVSLAAAIKVMSYTVGTLNDICVTLQYLLTIPAAQQLIVQRACDAIYSRPGLAGRASVEYRLAYPSPADLAARYLLSHSVFNHVTSRGYRSAASIEAWFVRRYSNV